MTVVHSLLSFFKLDFFVILIIIIIIRFIIKLYWQWRKMPPGPVPLPFVGNILDFRQRKGSHEILLDLSKKYGGIMSVFLFHTPNIIISKCKLAKVILQQPTFSHRPHSPMGDLYLQGHQDIGQAKYNPLLLFHRKILTKCIRLAISPERLEKVACKSIDMTIQEMLKHPHNVGAKLHMCHIVYNIFTELAYSKTYQIGDPEFLQLVHRNDSGLQEYSKDATIWDFIPYADYLPLLCIPSLNRTVQHLRNLRQHRINQLQEHRKTFLEGTIRDFYDALLNEQAILRKESPEQADSLSDIYLAYLILSFFTDDVDPTSKQFIWILLYLTLYSELQEQCHLQIKEVIGDRPPRLDDRSKLTLVEAFICETMRLRPVAAFSFPHGNFVDTKIGDYFVPAGSIITTNLYAMHVDPEEWDSPLEFNPRLHFLDAQNQLKLPASFLPFSFGRRVCPGDQLTKNVAFLVFTRLLQKVRFEKIEGENYTTDYDKDEILHVKPLPFSVKVSART